MNIALVCPYSFDLPGGVQSQVAGMAKVLSNDHSVTVLAPGTKVPQSLEGINVTLLGPTFGIRANGSVAPIALSLRAIAKLRRAMRTLHPDITIIHEPLVPVVSLAALYLSRGVRIGTFHRAGVTAGYRILLPLAGCVLRRLDYGVVVSEQARQTVSVLLGDRAAQFELIANAVDIDRFTPQQKGPRTPHSLFFLGRHEPRKGLSVLLKALKQLPDEFTLTIAGTGPETDVLQQQYPPNARMRWLGQIDDDELVRILHQTELFVAPSLGGESFGVVLLEAMAAGAPVLCSDLPGYRLAGGEAVTYTPPGDADGLVTQIQRLASDPELRDELSRRGADRASKFTFSVLKDQYLELANHRQRP